MLLVELYCYKLVPGLVTSETAKSKELLWYLKPLISSKFCSYFCRGLVIIVTSTSERLNCQQIINHPPTVACESRTLPSQSLGLRADVGWCVWIKSYRVLQGMCKIPIPGYQCEGQFCVVAR